MRLVRDYLALCNEATRYAVTIGNFDGFHLGHQAMLEKLQTLAKQAQVPTCVVLFEPHPQTYFSGQSSPRIMSFREKLHYLQQAGIAVVVCLRFNQTLAACTATAFIEQVLVKSLKLHTLVIGDDFCFGRAREGNLTLLQKAGLVYDFETHQVATCQQNQQRVSSTQIRQALQAGHLQTAAAQLGRPFTHTGRVIHGQKLGRTLGFPTANFPVQKNFPLQGVFLTRVDGLANTAYAVTNVGTRPTVSGQRQLVEAHLLNFSGQLYGQRLTLTFLKKLRDEKRFESLAALQQQITKDKALAEHLTTSMVGE